MTLGRKLAQKGSCLQSQTSRIGSTIFYHEPDHADLEAMVDNGSSPESREGQN